MTKTFAMIMKGLDEVEAFLKATIARPAKPAARPSQVGSKKRLSRRP